MIFQDRQVWGFYLSKSNLYLFYLYFDSVTCFDLILFTCKESEGENNKCNTFCFPVVLGGEPAGSILSFFLIVAQHRVIIGVQPLTKYLVYH
jgi:hypothetical protein